MPSLSLLAFVFGVVHALRVRAPPAGQARRPSSQSQLASGRSSCSHFPERHNIGLCSHSGFELCHPAFFCRSVLSLPGRRFTALS